MARRRKVWSSWNGGLRPPSFPRNFETVWNIWGKDRRILEFSGNWKFNLESCGGEFELLGQVGIEHLPSWKFGTSENVGISKDLLICESWNLRIQDISKGLVKSLGRKPMNLFSVSRPQVPSLGQNPAQGHQARQLAREQQLRVEGKIQPLILSKPSFSRSLFHARGRKKERKKKGGRSCWSLSLPPSLNARERENYTLLLANRSATSAWPESRSRIRTSTWPRKWWRSIIAHRKSWWGRDTTRPPWTFGASVAFSGSCFVAGSFSRRRAPCNR